jgi:hypothetical protein
MGFSLRLLINFSLWSIRDHALLRVFSAVLAGWLLSLGAGNENAMAASAKSPLRSQSASALPQEVSVGFYPTAIYSMNQQNSTFYADMYVWMRWKGDLDPTATLEYANNVEKWGFSNTRIYEKPMALKDGSSLQQMHVQGQFFQPLSLHEYPLDKHELNIVLEDSTYTTEDRVYRHDSGQSQLDGHISLPGWNITGWNVVTEPRTYATNFGDTGKHKQSTYSSIRIAVFIERPISFFVWKLILPMSIVLLLGCSALFINPSYAEVRLAAPPAALLSLVFLQQAYSSSLPDIGYLVLLDKIYVLAYAVVLCLMVTTIIGSSQVRSGDERKIARTRQIDMRVVSTVLVLFSAASLWLILSR